MISDSIVKKQRSYSCSIPNSSISISATNSTNSLINSSSSTPPCSGNGNISSINNQRLGNIEKMFETFQQSPSGDFKPTFYNPFEIKHRRRTTKSQFKVLESNFENNPKPSAQIRRELAARLGMTPRAVQVWFQNRRAKLKSQSSTSMTGGNGNGDGICNNFNNSTIMEICVNDNNEQDIPFHHQSNINNMITDSPLLERRHSMPTLLTCSSSSSLGGLASSSSSLSMPSNLGLPFKELHDAIFGNLGNTIVSDLPDVMTSSSTSTIIMDYGDYLTPAPSRNIDTSPDLYSTNVMNGNSIGGMNGNNNLQNSNHHNHNHHNLLHNRCHQCTNYGNQCHLDQDIMDYLGHATLGATPGNDQLLVMDDAFYSSNYHSHDHHHGRS